MVSIKDIAKQLGVSISTVSYALNGNPESHGRNEGKILTVAKELNYVPNAAARTLKKRETQHHRRVPDRPSRGLSTASFFRA